MYNLKIENNIDKFHVIMSIILGVLSGIIINRMFYGKCKKNNLNNSKRIFLLIICQLITSAIIFWIINLTIQYNFKSQHAKLYVFLFTIFFYGMQYKAFYILLKVIYLQISLAIIALLTIATKEYS